MNGKKFGRWSVLREVSKTPTSLDRQWLCRCLCGVERALKQGTLMSGRSRSCGCARRGNKGPRTHGGTGSKEYSSWQNMKKRCLDPKSTEYSRYGGRGITVCDRWKDSFENFLTDMGYKPALPYAGLERKDNNGPYCKDNCRWATRLEQANNRRDNHLITIGDRTQTLAQWCRERGVKTYTFTSRILRGWTAEKALTVPVRSWTRHPE